VISRARAAGVVLLLAASGVSHPAVAQTTDRQRAEAHFEAARRQVQAGRCDLAIEELRASIDYEPTSVGARLNLGDCYVTLGRLPDAFRQYKDAEANAVARNDARVETARRAAARVAEKLVRVILREPEPVVAGLVVTVDGVSAGARPWTIAVVPDRPHVVVANAPDGRTWRAEVTGKGGDAVRLDVELRGGASAPGPTVASAAPPPSDVGPHPLRTAGYVTGAVGLAALTAGAVFGGLALGSRSDLADAVNGDPACTGTYPSAQCSGAARQRLDPIEDRASMQATLATAGFVAGGALAIGGLLMIVLAPSSAAAPRAEGVGGVRLEVGSRGRLQLEGAF